MDGATRDRSATAIIGEAFAGMVEEFAAGVHLAALSIYLDQHHPVR